MKSILFSVAFFFVLVPWAFQNYGHWMDTTSEPRKSDIIVCLGGGTVERLNKAVELSQKGYGKIREVMLIGESYDTKQYLKQTYPQTSIKQYHAPKNTKDEVLFIKNYMIKHGYSSALIVTDPPHSRRVSILGSVLSVKGDDNLNLDLVSSEVSWWEAEKYYDDKRSSETVLQESMRILYSFVCYGMVNKLGGTCE